MNVDARYGSKMFEVAANMLNAAITAKTNKIEKKLKMVDLQLKKYAIDKKNAAVIHGGALGPGWAAKSDFATELFCRVNNDIPPCPIKVKFGC